ncbi:MAG TPA: lactate dehydrogenase [Marinagarivorans sp.]
MKVSVIGVGKVGSTLAFILSLKNVIRELVLVGRNQQSVLGDVLDLRHGQLFVDVPTKIIAGTVEDTAGSDIIAICASVPTPPNMHDRMMLANGNVALLKDLLPPLAKASPNAKILIVSNPVDVLVHFAIRYSGFPPERVFGTGTLVDSARFRQLLSEELNIHSEDIRAYILGEHGESQFAALSCADAGGEPLNATPARVKMAKKAASAGLEVFKLKGYTNYAVASAAADIIHAVVSDSKHTMPISIQLDGYYDIEDVCLSLPVVLGKKGIERILHPKLNKRERAQLTSSAEAIRKVIDSVDDQFIKH